MADIEGFPSVLVQDLVNQLGVCPTGMRDKFPTSPLTNEPATRKSSNLMHKIIGGEDNPVEARWLHSVWTRANT